MTTDCRRFNIYGRVQGVGFRAGTLRKADALGLEGWVRNHPQGHVEVLACGRNNSLDELAEWLHSGPPAARVARVESGNATDEHTPAQGFEIR